jgi:hypothetical protein
LSEIHLLLGVTRRKDDPKGPVTGLIYREGEKLRWGALDALFGEKPSRFFRLDEQGGAPVAQPLERVEFTVSGVPHFLFKQKDGKLGHETLAEKLQFSEDKKALLKPQKLPKPLPLATLAVEYLEVSRLSDAMRNEMLGGERSVGQLSEVLGIPAADKVLNEVLWDLGRRRWLTLHEMGDPNENAIGLNKPVPPFK